MFSPLQLCRPFLLSALVAANILGVASLAQAGTAPAPIVNPTHNLPMPVNHQWAIACEHDVNGALCTHAFVTTINLEHARMHEPAISLPTNWARLTPAEQVLVITNLERLSYHYPAYLGLNTALSNASLVAARQQRDVTYPVKGFYAAPVAGNPGFGGAWAQGSDALLADYMWMYDDGWGGNDGSGTSNIACTSAHAPGCWGHRDSLLGWVATEHFGVGTDCTDCEMGAAYAPGGAGSWATVIMRPWATPPKMYFTWAQELPYFTHPLPVAWHPPVTTTTTSTTTTTTVTGTTTTVASGSPTTP